MMMRKKKNVCMFIHLTRKGSQSLYDDGEKKNIFSTFFLLFLSFFLFILFLRTGGLWWNVFRQEHNNIHSDAMQSKKKEMNKWEKWDSRKGMRGKSWVILVQAPANGLSFQLIFFLSKINHWERKTKKEKGSSVDFILFLKKSKFFLFISNAALFLFEVLNIDLGSLFQAKKFPFF